YFNSWYYLCKHLIHKQKNKQFIPTFSETIRQHDYPLFIFGKEKLPTIDSLNNPWIQYGLQSIVDNSIEKENMSLNDLQNTLMKRKLDNNNFITQFDTLVMPFLNKIDMCEEVLSSSYQQKTWTSNNKRLAYIDN
ncbi:46289_t:CDS:2, partial [Gigaspora margarita]